MSLLDRIRHEIELALRRAGFHSKARCANADDACLEREGELIRAHLIAATHGRSPRPGGWAHLKEQLTAPAVRSARPALDPSWLLPWLRPGYRFSMAVMPALIVSASVLWAMNGSSGALLGDVTPAAGVSTRLEAAVEAVQAIASVTPTSELTRRQVPQRRTSRTLSQLGVLDSIDPARPMPHVEPAAAIDSTTGAVLPRDLLPGEDRDQMINPFGVRPPRPIFEPNQPMRPGYFRFTTA